MTFYLVTSTGWEYDYQGPTGASDAGALPEYAARMESTPGSPLGFDQ